MTADPVQALLDASPKRSCDLGNGESLTYRIFNSHNASNPNAIKLLFIPGYSTDATTLGGPEMALAFPDDHYVVAVNPRGYAGSTFHDPVDNHEGNADDLKLFLDKTGLRDVVAMGWSTGGGAAAWLAIKYPEVVRAAIMMNASEPLLLQLLVLSYAHLMFLPLGSTVGWIPPRCGHLR